MSGRVRMAVAPDRLWLSIAAGRHPWFLTLGVQRRIADPPAIPQTRHRSLLIRRDGAHLVKEDS